jgi:hypothetical protein
MDDLISKSERIPRKGARYFFPATERHLPNAAPFVSGSRAATKSPSVGAPRGRPLLAAFHRSDRTSAFGPVRKCLFDHYNHHCRGLLAVDSEAAPQIRIHADPSASVYAEGLIHTGREEDQPNTRVFNPDF